ncbi:hypothetical protein NW768_002216 [Fusarium equiseti]|uniref:DNA2/NAM7 helicase-like C-terminal domain-containing protein n=1 Tax=Fusarium equiseti TaxID=61235 RepID=A0ABQ8RNF5_FUSEQ|nr:hypothetical protein NW768_002216 [Fusarium equiseti]
MLLIHASLKGSLVLLDVQTAIIESYQGRDHEVVVLRLAFDKNTGPCFVAQPQRLNVATSRHKLFMAAFGHIRTEIAENIDKSIKNITLEGVKTSVQPRMFVNWFVEHNRLARVKGDR